MAELVAGELYTVRPQDCINYNKSYTLVKLTESANRALIEYLRNESKSLRKPNIRFNGGQGKICIPSSNSTNNGKGGREMLEFSFNVSSNVDMEGNQGLLECIEKKGKKNKELQRLGPLKNRIRVNANEDVYKTTLNRIGQLDQQQRKNCTMQIDWNSTSIGKKVKIDKNEKMSTQTAPKKNAAGRISTSVPPLPPPSPSATVAISSNDRHTDNVAIEQQNNSHVAPKVVNPLLMRRPLKDRVIHLLAVRPYKKLELYSAINRDGIRDGDKNRLTTTLLTVAYLRDNTYHLSRHMWTDVQDDWPYYTEVERQQMIKCKQQNMTPDGSDSGISVTSNQSPRFGKEEKSPVKLLNPYAATGRKPGYYNGADGFQTKRQRISHFQRTGPTNSCKNRASDDDVLHLATYSFDDIIERNGLSNTSNTSVIKRKENSSYLAGAPQKSLGSKPVLSVGATLANNDRIPANNVKSNDGTRIKSTHFRISSRLNGNLEENANNKCAFDKFTVNSSAKNNDKDNNSSSSRHMDIETLCNPKSSFAPESKALIPPGDAVCTSQQVIDQQNIPLGVAASNCYQSSSSISCDGNGLLQSPPALSPVSTQSPARSPNYISNYVRITSIEQRRKYKEDFNTIYNEYISLHATVEGAKQYLVAQGKQLRQMVRDSDEAKLLERHIWEKYNQVKYDKEFQLKKTRFEYLHEKLSHIKNLVNEYDEILITS